MFQQKNGIATDDPQTRIQFSKYYLYALSKAIQDGYDVGYIRWALLDNYEWGTFDKHYVNIKLILQHKKERSKKAHAFSNLF